MFAFRPDPARPHELLLMGIVNATPDSFSDGGATTEQAIERGLRLLDEGADWLDLGGESTRPGGGVVPVAEELNRILPVLTAWRRERPEVVISVDTRKAEVARAALAAGATIINDVSALAYSRGELARAVAEAGAGLILNHARGTPATMDEPRFTTYADVVAEVKSELRAAFDRAEALGVARTKLLADPGLGFAKTPADNWRLLRHAGAFAELGPVVIGYSRKRFLQQVSGPVPPREREAAGLGVALALAQQGGVSVLRVHEVKGLRTALAAYREAGGGFGAGPWS